jgi:hypothetical protein
MASQKAKQVAEIPPEIRGIHGRLRYALDTRIAEDPALSQNKIATRAGIDGGNLSAYVRGQRLEGIQAVTLIKVARALRVNIAWLLEGIEPSGLTIRDEPPPDSERRQKQ